MVRIFEDDSVNEIARKIFEDFKVFDSCTITGFVMLNENGMITKDKNLASDVIEKGDAVWQQLKKLDKFKYMQIYGKKLTRIRTYVPNSIGGFVSQPIFRHNRRKDGDTIKWAIWRHQ